VTIESGAGLGGSLGFSFVRLGRGLLRDLKAASPLGVLRRGMFFSVFIPPQRGLSFAGVS